MTYNVVLYKVIIMIYDNITIPEDRIDRKIVKYQEARALINTPDGNDFYNERIAILEEARSVFAV